MPEITRSNNCGNSPKNKFAESIAIALELNDPAFLTDVLGPDLVWEKPDGTRLSKDDANRYFKSSRENPVAVSIDYVVTHGKAGAVNGTVQLKGGSLKRFCHVIEFSNTKCDVVRRLVSYESPDLPTI